MRLKTAVKYLSLTWEMKKRTILSAMEYRASFLMHVFGMMLNDTAIIALWFIFFQKFPSIKGWEFNDTLLLFSFSTMIFGLVMVLTYGAFELAKTITRGELDYYLTFPQNLIWHIAVSKTKIAAIGDFIFSIIIFLIASAFSLEKIAFFIPISLLAALIFFNFILITQSIAFFVGNFEDAAEHLFHALLGFTLYPQTTFYGALKVIMFTIIPAFFIATVPVQLIKSFSPTLFLGMLACWLATSLIALIVFRAGLRRYESGNLINIRV